MKMTQTRNKKVGIGNTITTEVIASSVFLNRKSMATSPKFDTSNLTPQMKFRECTAKLNLLKFIFSCGEYFRKCKLRKVNIRLFEFK